LTKFIGKPEKTSSYLITFIITLGLHFLILFFVKKDIAKDLEFSFLKNRATPIELLSPVELKKIKSVGIKDGKKDHFQPDFMKNQMQRLGINNMTPPQPNIPPNFKAGKTPSPIMNTQNFEPKKENANFFQYKKSKTIQSNREHDEIKVQTLNQLPSPPSYSKAQNISNFEIRLERPDGVSEDELNSDEKAFYSFYKRSYANYVSKLYATYETVRVQRPGIDQDFNDKHLLMAKVEYDENGNIVSIKILKSSQSDHVHYFFEEALKKLNLPNPPKVFVKNRQNFSIYYQVLIN